MVRRVFFSVFMLISVLIFPLERRPVVILPFSGSAQEIVNTIEAVFTDLLISSHYYEVLRRDGLETVIMGDAVYISDSLSSPEILKEIGELANAHFIFSGSVSELENKYYLSVKLFSVETSRIIVSKRTAGFYIDDIDYILHSLILNMSLESGIRENPPSILNPGIADADSEKGILVGDIGSGFIDTHFGTPVLERMIFFLFLGETRAGIFEVTEVTPDAFLAVPIRGSIPEDVLENPGYSLEGRGRRMPWAVLFSAGYDGGIFSSLGVSYTSANFIGAEAFINYSDYFTEKKYGLALYGTASFGTRTSTGFRIGLGFDYTAPPYYPLSIKFRFSDNERVMRFYPSFLLQFITPATAPLAFKATYRYNHYSSPVGHDFSGWFRNSIFDLGIVLHPGYFR